MSNWVRTQADMGREDQLGPLVCNATLEHLLRTLKRRSSAMPKGCTCTKLGPKVLFRTWQDSNLQSSDPKSGALSIRPHVLILLIILNMFNNSRFISLWIEIASLIMQEYKTELQKPIFRGAVSKYLVVPVCLPVCYLYDYDICYASSTILCRTHGAVIPLYLVI
jgi:hypothetical protein